MARQARQGTGSDDPATNLDTIYKAIKEMLVRSKERGYISYGELNTVLPRGGEYSELVENTLMLLSEIGVEIIENEEIEQILAWTPAASYISYSELRQNLEKHFDEVCRRRAPLIITRRNGEPVVMLALSEFKSREETLHLLRNSANAEHLFKSLAEAEAGEFIETDLDE